MRGIISGVLVTWASFGILAFLCWLGDTYGPVPLIFLVLTAIGAYLGWQTWES